MQAFPHTYQASSSCAIQSHPVTVIAGADPIQCAPPPEFDGPGGFWTPEQLLLSAVSTCFVLSFKAIARASGYDWIGIECDVTGLLDKVDRSLKFTRLEIDVKLVVGVDSDQEMGTRLLEKAEKTCLVSNSLNCERQLSSRLVVSTAD